MLFMEIDSDRSVETWLREYNKAKEAADREAADWQKKIKPGDCFRRVVDGLEIFGEVLREYHLPDMVNMRECRCYSFVCPMGEMGYVHVSQMDELMSRKSFKDIKHKLGTAYKLAMRRIGQERLALA